MRPFSSLSLLLSLSSLGLAVPQALQPFVRPDDVYNVNVPEQVDDRPILEAFVSYSIELAFWPDFAGNLASPNDFSNQLLDNLAAIQGTKPYLRVGGNTQDYARYDSKLTTATQGTVDTSRSPDYPTTLFIGPKFFESYQTIPGSKLIHGFNLGYEGRNGTSISRDVAGNTAVAPLVCDAFTKMNVTGYFELGNEPDLYRTSAQGAVRTSSWNEQQYVQQWRDGKKAIVNALKGKCSTAKWIAPDFSGLRNNLNISKTWKDARLNSDKDITLFSVHNYISGATTPGVTLRGTLMNHTRTTSSVNALVSGVSSLSLSIPFILGETNSLYNQGAPGLSDSFGAALWNLDFALYCAASGIKRIHMHQGTNYRYASWQPIDTVTVAKQTKAPYYGNIATATALGNAANASISVSSLSFNSSVNAEVNVGYVTYEDGKIARVTIINLDQWNSTGKADARPNPKYQISLPLFCTGGIVNRLMANGSDVTTGITFNGLSYDYINANGTTQGGKEKHISGSAYNEPAWVGQDGMVVISVPASSAAVLHLDC